MKIALCLYGYFNNREDINAGEKGYQYILNNILKHDVDIFIHSWDIENQKRILELYKPKQFIFDAQKDFNNFEVEKKINENFDRSKYFSSCKLQSSLSFFYSRGKAIDLIDDNYDIVIVARFDLGVRSKEHLGYNVSLMKFDPTLNMDFIYSAMWKQLNAGYADQWFYSSYDNIKKLSKMYDQAIIDMQVKSDYHRAITTGWFDSHCDCLQHQQINGNKNCETSNEVLKDIKSKKLMKYPTWQIINNHIYHKWFFKQNGLYEISKWI